MKNKTKTLTVPACFNETTSETGKHLFLSCLRNQVTQFENIQTPPTHLALQRKTPPINSVQDHESCI